MNEEKPIIVLKPEADKSAHSSTNSLVRERTVAAGLCEPLPDPATEAFLALLWAAQGNQQSSSQFSSQMAIQVQGLGENELEGGYGLKLELRDYLWVSLSPSNLLPAPPPHIPLQSLCGTKNW